MPCSFEKPVTRIYKLLSLSLQPLQAKPFFFAATKNRIGRRPCGAAGTGATPAAFYLGLCRLRGTCPCLHPTTMLQAGYSSMRRRRLESDAESAVATTVAGGLIFDAATKIRIGREHRCDYEFCRRNHAAIPKFTPSNQESLQHKGQNAGKTCSDSQIHPLKSRITARWRSFPGKNLQ